MDCSARRWWVLGRKSGPSVIGSAHDSPTSPSRRLPPHNFFPTGQRLRVFPFVLLSGPSPSDDATFPTPGSSSGEGSCELASRARLFKEYKEVQREKSADPDIQLICDDSNIFKWTALIKGPSETPFEGGVFQLAFSIPEQYPLLPPQVRFLTKIFHPNVHFKTGEICLDILKNAWSPAWTLQSVCRAIIALMAHPEPDSPLNCDSGNLLRSGDIRGYQSMARMYTRLAAMAKKG
uniref:E2 ubiquitin-conjugating enzyme n=1 Tax=Oryza barthii TaxID=65489 RepID=A0A0D3F7Z5_9ORYZ